MQDTPKAKLPWRKPRRLREVRQFTLSRETSDRIDRLAVDRGISRSDVIERAIRLDYALVFTLFLEGKGHAEVVVATGIEPALVRSLFDEYRAGYQPVEHATPLAIAHARERTAREKRLAAEASAQGRIAEAAARERTSAHKAWVDLADAQTRKHLGELAENSKVLDRAERRRA